MSLARTYSTVITTIGTITIVLAPAFWPGIASAIGAAVWAVVYGGMWLHAQSFDAATQLPVVLPWNQDDGWIPWAIVLMGVGAGIKGIRGAAAMAIVWIPMLLWPSFQIGLGTAVTASSPQDYWNKHWTHECYDDASTAPDWDGKYASICKYTPIAGNNLPNFITDPYGKVLSVFPNGDTSQKASNSAQSKCVTTTKTIIKDNGDTTVDSSTVCT